MDSMELVVSFLQRLQQIPRDYDGGTAKQFFDEKADIAVYSCVLYILLVFVVPETIMKNRKPFNLKPLFILWNLFLTVFSFFGAMASVRMMMMLMEVRGFYLATCHFDPTRTLHGEYGFWLFAFLISKIPEMLDTVFLVFQKKPVIFLHWYHHLTVAIYCWHSGHALVPSGLWFATMNYCVHAIMYFYYLVCACGFRKIIRPIAPLITALQLSQMVVGTGITGYTVYHTYWSGAGCAVDRTNMRMSMVMYGSYFVLFAILFFDLYLKKREKSAKRSAPVQNNHTGKKKKAS